MPAVTWFIVNNRRDELSQMSSGNWKFCEPKIRCELSWTKTVTPHLLPWNPCHRGKLTDPVTVFLAEMSLTVQSFSSFLTTKSLDRTLPLFSPFGQSVTNPLSYNATMTLAPRLSTFVLRAPVRETCKESDPDLWNVAYSNKIFHCDQSFKLKNICIVIINQFSILSFILWIQYSNLGSKD